MHYCIADIIPVGKRLHLVKCALYIVTSYHFLVSLHVLYNMKGK